MTTVIWCIFEKSDKIGFGREGDVIKRRNDDRSKSIEKLNLKDLLLLIVMIVLLYYIYAMLIN